MNVAAAAAAIGMLATIVGVSLLLILLDRLWGG